MRVKKIVIFLIIFMAAFLIEKVDFNWRPNNDDFNQGEVMDINIAKQKILKVVFFDVGQGDSIFIETPNKKQILIDGGDNNMVLEKLKKQMSITDRSLDAVVLTHPHADHLTGLIEVLKRYEVGEVWLSGVVHTSAVYLDFLNLINEKKIPVKIIYGCHETEQNQKTQNYDGAYLINEVNLIGQNKKFNCGKKLTVDPEVEFFIMSPLMSLEGKRVKKLNNSSVVMKLAYGENTLMLTGDAENEAENEMLNVYGNNEFKSAILKIGHHGSLTATSEEFLTATQPTTAVISVGKNNEFGHPSLRIIRRLERAGIKILRTDEEGDIEFIIDNKEAKISEIK